MCSVAVRCNELDSGPMMQWLHTFAIKDRLFLVVSQVSSPSLSSIADDDQIKSYVQSFLVSMLSQPSGQISLGSNPFFSAPLVECLTYPLEGLLGGDVPRA